MTFKQTQDWLVIYFHIILAKYYLQKYLFDYVT